MQGFRVGQRVACAGGGYAVHADYVTAPRNLLAALPDTVDFQSAAFTTLGAIALHGFRLAQIQLGERLAVIGLGLLGLLAAQIARAAGCTVLGIDLDERRLELGRSLGIQTIHRSQAEEAGSAFSRGRGCDAVLICADTPADDPVNLAGTLARDRARVVAVGAVGLNLPRKIYYEKELTFLNSRSYGPGRYDPSYEEGLVEKTLQDIVRSNILSDDGCVAIQHSVREPVEEKAGVLILERERRYGDTVLTFMKFEPRRCVHGKSCGLSRFVRPHNERPSGHHQEGVEVFRQDDRPCRL
jgi:hypothetical protein